MDGEAVKGNPHIVGQEWFHGGVKAHLMAEMREVCHSGSYCSYNVQSLL